MNAGQSLQPRGIAALARWPPIPTKSKTPLKNLRSKHLHQCCSAGTTVKRGAYDADVCRCEVATCSTSAEEHVMPRCK